MGPDMAENCAFDEQKTAKEEQLSRGNGNRGGNREKIRPGKKLKI